MHEGMVFNAKKKWISTGFFPCFHGGRLCENGGEKMTPEAYLESRLYL
jgi:hypothetical protein